MPYDDALIAAGMPPDSWVDSVFNSAFFVAPDLPVWRVKHDIAQLLVCTLKGSIDGKTRAESEHILINSMRKIDLDSVGEKWSSEQNRVMQAVLNQIYGKEAR